MSEGEIPPEMKEFLRRWIPSVGHLDVLLLLFEVPDLKMNSGKVSQLLRTNNEYAQSQLRELCHAGFLKADGDGNYYCDPGSEYLELVNKLKVIYKLKRPAIISCIYDRPADPVQQLADAFKIKKD
jgi:hypothetical protein